MGEEMDLAETFKQFQDYLAPKLDVYEQAIYLYILRHSLMEGREEVVIALKSARTRVACGIGERGRPMSEGTAYLKLQSLQTKGCLKIVASERTGRRIRVHLPSEIDGLIPEETEAPVVALEDIDFFSIAENREAILNREQHKCFYCLCQLTSENWVLEHVISRPNGNNSYKNLVAACRRCNNRKNNGSAEDHLRSLYREGFLEAQEFENRLSHLESLKGGDLKPCLNG